MGNSFIASGGTDAQILHSAMAGAVPSLCSMLLAPDNKIIQVALEGLENILRAAGSRRGEYINSTGTLDHIIEIFHSAGGTNMIESLCQHKTDSIANRAISIIVKHLQEDNQLDIAADGTCTGTTSNL